MSFAKLFALNAAPSNQMEIWSALSCLTVKCSLSAALHQDFHSVWSDMEPGADWDDPWEFWTYRVMLLKPNLTCFCTWIWPQLFYRPARVVATIANILNLLRGVAMFAIFAPSQVYFHSHHKAASNQWENLRKGGKVVAASSQSSSAWYKTVDQVDQPADSRDQWFLKENCQVVILNFTILSRLISM